MARATIARNFHLPLPESIHRELRDLAARSGRPATVLVREALEGWLEAERRARVHAELRSYAERFAGTEVDLDSTLEAAAVEELLPRPRRRKVVR